MAWPELGRADVLASGQASADVSWLTFHLGRVADTPDAIGVASASTVTPAVLAQPEVHHDSAELGLKQHHGRVLSVPLNGIHNCSCLS
jgi:hypothetical protein